MLVDAKRATWTEVSTTMSMMDVLDLHDACNAIARARPRDEDED